MAKRLTKSARKKKVERCVKDVKKTGQSKRSSFKICNSAIPPAKKGK